MRRPLSDYLLLGLAVSAFAAAAALAQAPAHAPTAKPAATSPVKAPPAPSPEARTQFLEAVQKGRAGDLAPLIKLAEAGNAGAQTELGNIYFRGVDGKPDLRAARKWFEKAAAQKHPQACRTLGEMVMKGQGGKKDKKKAMQLWFDAEKAGDPLAPILVADQMFSDITGGQTPRTGQFAFKGGIPAADVDVAIDWYKEALKRDPRPDARQRAQVAINALQTFQSAAQVKVDKTKK